MTHQDHAPSIRFPQVSRPTTDDRKSAILDAAVAVIIEVGYTQMTVADVAARAGVSTALVHYHFASKSALIAAALRLASDDDKELRESIAFGPGTALERIDGVLCGSLPEDENDASWLLWIETWGETRRNAEIRAVMADLDEHEIKILRELIADGDRNGELACADPSGAAARLAALRDGLVIEHTLYHPERPIELMVGHLRGSIRTELGVRVAG